MARTNLSVDRRVFEEFSAEASRRNMTLTAFANETLAAAAKISSLGGDPAQIYNIWTVVAIMRQADVITLPSDFVEHLIVQLYEIDRERLLQDFNALGSSVVGLLRIAADDVSDLTNLVKKFGFIVPIKHFAINNNHNGDIQVDVVGTGRTMATTECSCEFLKPILEGYGIAIAKTELHPGAIRMWGQKRGWADKEFAAMAAAADSGDGPGLTDYD